MVSCFDNRVLFKQLIKFLVYIVYSREISAKATIMTGLKVKQLVVYIKKENNIFRDSTSQNITLETWTTSLK